MRRGADRGGMEGDGRLIMGEEGEVSTNLGITSSALSITAVRTAEGTRNMQFSLICSAISRRASASATAIYKK